MSTESLEKNILQWMATRSDEVVFDPQEGFFSFDMVVDAYKKGQDEGKDTFKAETQQKLREKYLNNANKAITVVSNLDTYFRKNKIYVTKFFLNNSLAGSSIIVAIAENAYQDEKLINLAYDEIAKTELQSSREGFNLSLFLLQDTDTLDYDLLKADGYRFAFNIPDGSKIY